MERTKLHQFMDRYAITDTELARESGVSIRFINYVKLGEKEPRRPYMAAILAACQTLTGKRVAITDLFDFSDPRLKEAA